MPKIKILVNWNSRNIIHCQSKVGSPEYVSLLRAGYVEVGEIKVHEELPIFWNSEYFDPNAKYQRNIATLNT